MRNHPKPSFSRLRKMAFEFDCTNCEASLKRIIRFRSSRLLAGLFMWIAVSLGYLGVISSSVALEVFLPIVLLTIAAQIWDHTFPRLHLRTIQNPQAN
jgi:hypothetical protein